MGNLNSTKEAIKTVIINMMDRVMDNVLINDPFLEDIHRAKRPLYAALVPEEIFKGSHFERRFVTPFGKAWENLAVVVATAGLGYGVRNYEIQGTIRVDRLRRIADVLNHLEHPRKDEQKIKPNWDQEMSYILGGGGELIPVTVICDVYVENQSKHQRYSYELKAPLPNSDITKVK